MIPEFVGQSVELVGSFGGDDTVESAARTCTQTETDPSKSAGFVERLVKRGHLSPVEFGYADMLIECDRAIQQELTRHRHFSFNVESTRWCDYTKKPLRFVTKPPEGMDVPDEAVEFLEEECRYCAEAYDILLELGAPRDYARKVLPLATASKVRMAGNFRTWLEMLPKRLAPAAHPEIRQLAGIMVNALSGVSETLFGGMRDDHANDRGLAVRGNADTDGDNSGDVQHSAIDGGANMFVAKRGPAAVKVKLDDDAFMPSRAHATDAGADIRTPIPFEIDAGKSAIVHTGVHIETPHGCATMIKSKSGLNVKHGIMSEGVMSEGIVSEGVIDEGFDGEIIVRLYNHSEKPYRFERGDKITQLVIVPVLYAAFERADEIGRGERGSAGYGSTGR